MKWFIAHIVPRIHWTTYGENGKRYFHIWRQWFGKCWSHAKFEIKG